MYQFQSHFFNIKICTLRTKKNSESGPQPETCENLKAKQNNWISANKLTVTVIDNQINMAESPDNRDKVMFISHPQETLNLTSQRTGQLCIMSLSKPKRCSLSHLYLCLQCFEEIEQLKMLSEGPRYWRFVPVLIPPCMPSACFLPVLQRSLCTPIATRAGWQ